MATPYSPQSSGTHLLTLQEAVSLGYGAYQTLRKYIADGSLPAVKIGKRVKVLRSDLDALAAPVRPSAADVEARIERLVEAAAVARVRGALAAGRDQRGHRWVQHREQDGEEERHPHVLPAT